MKILSIFLVLLCVNIQSFKCNLYSFLEEVEGVAWNTVFDEMCYLLVDKEDLLSTSNLRIVENTIYASKVHDFYPSAAESLRLSPFFEPTKKTVIFVHGYNDDPFQLPGRTIANALRKVGGYNILELDSSSAMSLDYLRSAANVRNIGTLLASFIYELTKLGVKPDNLHLVGHSLGAHISGFAGKGYEKLTFGQKLPRITGLDPANPCFHNITSEHRLAVTDARFVDVIHTNPGILGLNISIGHADFFPNRGNLFQPGCDYPASHSRAWMYFAESITNPNNFIGLRCDSWNDFVNSKCAQNTRAVMGFHTPNTTTGTYYLVTRNVSEYGLGIQGIQTQSF